MQRAPPLPVRSQAGWANMGQHLQHKLGNVEVMNIKAHIGTYTRHVLLNGDSAHLERC